MNFNQWPKLGCVFLISFLLVSCEKEVVLHDIDAEIQQLMQEHELPSLSACIIKDETIVWSRYYGHSDLGNGVQASEQTIYHIASISKLFIVTAIMQLEEQGRINIDADINTYLPISLRHPSFPDVPITTRFLLTHTSGLAWPQSYNGNLGLWVSFEQDQAPPPSEWVPQFLLPDGEHYDPDLWKSYPPGVYEMYSNIGSCVVAYLVEQISGQDFRDYCRKNIFDPLEMYSTSYYYSDLPLEDIALMYENPSKFHRQLNDRVYPSGGVKCTVGDLGRFAMAYMNKGILDGNRILKEETVEKIWEVQNEVSGRCLHWEKAIGGWYGHTGGLEVGASTTLDIHPQSKRAIILFTNVHKNLVTPGFEIYGLVRQKANEYE
jgi:CubicO group peptidase (beta-lactamase class C family)